MQKLLTLKTLSKTLKNVQVSPSLPSYSPKTLSNQLSISPLLQIHSKSCISRSFYGVFRNQPLENHTGSTQGRSFFDRGIQLIKFPLTRRRFDGYCQFDFSRYSRGSWMPTTDGVVWSLIGTNVVVFCLWRTLDRQFMIKNFTISMYHFIHGRIHTLITSAFSHVDSWHLMSNMLGLYFFGTSIGNMFGPKFLLKLYLAGAVGGSSFFLAHNYFSSSFYRGPYSTHAQGASGAVNAIMLLDIFLFPKAIHYVNFFIPVPAVALGAFLIGSDLLRMMEGNSHISGAAHLGGAAVAALAWARIRRRI